MAIKVPNTFSIKQKVYLVCDPDQNICLVTAIIVLDNNIMYRVAGADGEDEYFDFELTDEKQVI